MSRPVVKNSVRKQSEALTRRAHAFDTNEKEKNPITPTRKR
jgi:hypothetical protein